MRGVHHSDAFISTMVIPSQNPPMHKADQQQMSLPSPGGPSLHPPPYERPQEPAKSCAKWRFIKAFLVAALIWFLMCHPPLIRLGS
jgi:hypothetical protein